MKVYVDELPKDCESCPCYSYSEGFCNCEYWWQKYKEIKDVQEFTHLGYKQNERPSDCPLQPLTDYTKQVRNEVCEEIRVKAEDCYGEECYEGYIPTAYVISEKELKQIQGE